jgi:hypothetical protein
MDEKQLAKLIRKNINAANRSKKERPARKYDPTLTRQEADDTDIERSEFFDEMKRREF